LSLHRAGKEFIPTTGRGDKILLESNDKSFDIFYTSSFSKVGEKKSQSVTLYLIDELLKHNAQQEVTLL
jgi:hypothetical protein